MDKGEFYWATANSIKRVHVRFIIIFQKPPKIYAKWKCIHFHLFCSINVQKVPKYRIFVDFCQFLGPLRPPRQHIRSNNYMLELIFSKQTVSINLYCQKMSVFSTLVVWKCRESAQKPYICQFWPTFGPPILSQTPQDMQEILVMYNFGQVWNFYTLSDSTEYGSNKCKYSSSPNSPHEFIILENVFISNFFSNFDQFWIPLYS